MPLKTSLRIQELERKQREEEEASKRRARELAVQLATGSQNGSNSNSTNSSTTSQKSSYGSQTGSQTTPAEKALFKMSGRRYTDLNNATARSSSTGNTNKTRTLDRTNDRTYNRYDTEALEKTNVRKNYVKERDQFRKEHPVGRWLGAEGNNAIWGLDAELAKGIDFFAPDVLTPKFAQDWINRYKEEGEKAQKKVEEERAGSWERTLAGTVGGESIKNIPSATMAYLSGGLSTVPQVAGKAVPTLLNANELAQTGSVFTRALNQVAKETGGNPMFWETFARTIGTTYEKELQNGADPIRATMSAYTNALLNAQIEVGGGIEVYDPSEDFLKALARSAKEEGLEEVQQYAVENLVNKAMGSNTAKWFSLTRGQDAVVNPVDMAEQGFYGAITGGLLSGGRTALANTRANIMDTLANPVSQEAVQEGMADQRGLVNRGLVQDRGEGVSTKAKSIAQELQAQLDKGEELQPNQVKRLIREINKESNVNEQSLEKARIREVGKSLDEGTFVEETGLNLEQEISKQKDSALESRSREKARAILGENASDNEVASVTKVVIGTANSSDIDTVLTKPSLKNAVAEIVNDGADANSKIQIPINNAEARTVLENLTAVKGIANRNAILKETQEENAEDIKALLTNLNSGGKDLFANHLAEGRQAIGDVYQNRFYRLFSEGTKENADFDDAYKRLITPLGADVEAIFTPDFARQIFAQGKASVVAENAKATAKSLADKYANRTSGLTFENNDESLISESDKKGLEVLAKAGDVEIRIMKSLTATDKEGKALLTKDGKKLVANGMYHDGVIYISADTKNKLITVAKHELTHYIKEMSPDRYQELEDFVLKKWYKNDPTAFAKRVEEYQRLYKDATPEEAREELIADASEAFFTDEATIQEAVSFSKKLGKAIHDGIKHILDAFTGDNRTYRGYGDFMKDLGILQEAERMWLEALEDSQQRKRNARGNATAEDYVDASTQYTTSDEKHSLVESDDEIERLNSEPTQKSYRAMALIDGKLYPPMATKVKDENGKWVLQQGADIGQWIKSDITTDHRMFNSKGQFLLKKDNGGSPLEVAYNPYIHSSDVMLNDQFASAHKRPNLVVVEGEIPRSELENGKRAEHDLDDGRHIKAKDPTGTVQWKAGVVQSDLTGTRTVFLTNHFKPTRVVPDSEVARSIQKMVAGTDVVIPYNVVTPSLRQELQKLGVKMEQSKQKGYQVDLNAKYSVTPEEDQAYMDAVNRGDMETAQRMVDEQAKRNGYDIKAYHGTNAQFTRFDPDKLGSKNFMAGSAYLGFFASASKETAESYTGLNSMDAMATVFSSQSKDYMEKIKRKYNYDERQAELDNQREQFFENYRRENRYYEEVEDPIKELKQQFEQNRQIFVRKDGSDYFDNFMKDFEDNHRTSLVYDWNKKHLNDMYRAWEETQAYKDNQELEQEIYKEWEKYEIKRRGYVPHVLDLYLKMERPFVHDFKGEGRDTESFASRMAQAKEEGYDGCIFKNVEDGADIDDIYTVFSNTQLKSADPVTYDDDGNVIPLSQRFNEENEDIRWSVSEDSDGNKLSEGQVEFFNNSQVRDKDGKLLKVYHGTDEDFYEFSRDQIGRHGSYEGAGFNFTPSEARATGYAFANREGKVLGGYLNITNPLSSDRVTFTASQLAKIIRDIDPTGDDIIANYAQETRDYGKPSFIERESLYTARQMLKFHDSDVDIYSDLSASGANSNAIISAFEDMGYDGVIHYNPVIGNGKFGGDIKTLIAFRSNQFKDADNLNPTEDADIRYSVTTENEPLPKGGKIPKSMEKWAKKVGLETLSKQDSKVPVNVSVRSLRSYWYVKNGRNDEARVVNNSLRSVADALQKLSVKYKYIGLDDAMNATVHYRTDEKGRPTSVYLTCQVKNAEYEINYDFTTICAKRAPLQKVLERFIKTEGERMDTLYDELKLDEEGMYKLRLILEQAGFEVSCIACFVEQNRYSQQAQAETVATDWNKALDEWARENGTRVSEHFNLASLDLKSIPFEEIKKGFTNYYKLMRDWKNAHPKESANVAVKNRMLIEAIPYFRKRMNPSEYASIDGQRALMAMGNKKTNLYNLLKRGQGYAKQSVPFVAYNGEIALLPDRVKGKSLLNYLMGIGGARAQSASDFQIEYLYDYMQMVADLSARKLPMHMYTKVIELAELFGKTGIKINLSAMCAVDNSLDGEYAGLKKVNGKYVYNISNQSIDYNKAVKLQRQEGYSKNIGIIMVTLSKYHMLKALGDKDVRYIIGYHSSKMPAVVSKASDMESATDYTKINKTNRLNDTGRELFDRAMSIAKGDTELERYKNALRIFDDMIQSEVNKGKDRPRRGNEYTRYMSGYKANTADFDVYEDIKKTNDPRKTADNYIQYCMDNDLIPMYFPFAFHENYYKCEVYDFNMFDNNTGEYAPMEAVQNIYPDLDMTKGETDTTKFMNRVSRHMKAQNEKNKALEPMYERVEKEARETLRIDIDGNDHVDMDETGIDPNENKHRADILEGLNEAKQSLSEVEDSSTVGRLQKENATLKEAVWKRNEQISVERMRAEMDVQRAKREANESKRKAVNETRERYEEKIENLKQQQKERERRAKERREEAERKEKENRKRVHERARARREASEARARQEKQQKAEAKRERKQDSKARTRLLEVARRLSKIKSTDEFYKIRDQLIGNLDLEAKSMTGRTRMKLEDLEVWYQDQVEHNDWFVRNEALEKKFERLRKTHISDMSLEDVQNLTEILLMLEHKVRNDKKLINSQYKKDVFMASFETSEGIKQSKGLKFKGLHKLDNVFVGQVLSPVRYMRRITGYDEDNPLMIATRELEEGQIKSLDYRMNALKPFNRFTDPKFTAYLNGNKAPEIEVNATTIDMKPTTVKIIPAIRIWFYLSSMNADNMRHIVNGGVRMPDIELLKKGNRSEAYDEGTLVRFSKSQVQAIIDGMTQEEKAYANEVYRYFNEVAPEATNDVSEMLDGISIARVKNYVPIHVDKTFLDVEADTIKRDGTLEGMGSHKERVHSPKPAYAEDISDVVMRAIEADSKYVGMAIPIRNFNKIYRSSSMESARGQAEHLELTGKTDNAPSNLVYGDEQTATYRTRTGGYVSVQDAITKKWTSDALGYIDDFLSDLQFPQSKVGAVEKTLRSLTSNYAGAVLTLNASVALKQSASFPTAGAVLGWKPLIKSFGKVGKLDLEYADSITPLLNYRAEGFNFREAGDIQNRSGRDNWFKRIMRTPVLNWIQGMDLLTTRKLFKASEIYVQDNFHLKRGQVGYDEKVAEIFNRVITETQPNYTVMERAGHLRSDSTLERTLSMFKTQPYQNFNIWYDAVGNYLAKKGAYKKSQTTRNREAFKEASVNLGRATTSQIAQLAVFAMMTSLWALARGKDDKWRDEEGNLSFASYLKQLAHDMLGGVASEFFLGSDVFSALDSVINDTYYSGFSSVTDSSINDFFNTGMDMMKLLQTAWSSFMGDSDEEVDVEKIKKQMEKVVTEGGRFSGIPTGNIINLKNLMYRWVSIAKDGEYIGEYEALKMSFAKDTYKKELLFKAYRQDKRAFNELRKMMIDDGFKEDTLDDYIKKQTKENKTDSEQREYDSSMQTLEKSSIWENASTDDQDYYEGIIENLSVGIETKQTGYVTDKATNGLTNEQVILYKLALKQADARNNSNGSYDKDEKAEALQMLMREFNLTKAQQDAIQGK